MKKTAQFQPIGSTATCGNTGVPGPTAWPSQRPSREKIIAHGAAAREIFDYPHATLLCLRHGGLTALLAEGHVKKKPLAI